LGINYETTGVLLFNSSGSKFTELSPEQHRSNTEKEFDSVQKRVVFNHKNRPVNYIFLKEQKLISTENLFKKRYFVEENIPKINWKISDEYKNIGNYKCQKAEGIFRGRTYIAWFTNQLPVPYGPWKLQGLPGLILEVIDSKKELIFLTKKITLNNEAISINFNEFDSTISLKEFIQILPEKYEERAQIISSKLPKGRSFHFQAPPRETQKEIIYEWEEDK
jgi:GLPGLI family protein